MEKGKTYKIYVEKINFKNSVLSTVNITTKVHKKLRHSKNNNSKNKKSNKNKLEFKQRDYSDLDFNSLYANNTNSYGNLRF